MDPRTIRGGAGLTRIHRPGLSLTVSDLGRRGLLGGHGGDAVCRLSTGVSGRASQLVDGVSAGRWGSEGCGEQLAPPLRYEHKVAGDLIHVDVKKLGRIPDGGGWRAHGRGTDGHRASKRGGQRPGYVYLHTALDDCSRLAYTEELGDEKGVTAAGFWERAREFFAAHGIEEIHRVLSDNGSCYRSAVFNAALGDGVKHKYTRRVAREDLADARIDPRRTGRSSGTTAPSPASGPTPRPGIPTRRAATNSPRSYTATTTIDPTPHSKASAQSCAPRPSPTCMGSTSKSAGTPTG